MLLTFAFQTELDEAIYALEEKYLNETSLAGNIIRGFDSYIKNATTTTSASGTINPSATNNSSGAGSSSRRRQTFTDQDRLFSRSSVSFMESMRENRDGAADQGGTSSPGNLMTPTTGAATPTTPKAGGTRGNKKAIKGDKGGDDDEEDGPKTKRLKITYGRNDKD